METCKIETCTYVQFQKDVYNVSDSAVEPSRSDVTKRCLQCQ